MCTVSFIPTKGKVFITSNRDENVKRPLALPPSLKMHGQSQIIAPKDPWQVAPGLPQKMVDLPW